MKLSFKLLCDFYSGLITFVIPSIWPRNFPKEYGQWAGNESLRYNFWPGREYLDFEDYGNKNPKIKGVVYKLP